MENQEVESLNPEFPYRIIGPDPDFFGLTGDLPSSFYENAQEEG